MSELIYLYLKSDGFVRPCRKGCPNCTHCTDVWWDYSHGIYHCVCELQLEGPCCEQYTNDGTKPITVEEYNQIKEQENQKIMDSGIIYQSTIFEGEDDDDVDICPYTDRPCRNAMDCAHCEVETAERLWVRGEEVDDE